MVKNKEGGNRSKKFGRKFLQTKGSGVFRFAQEEGEIYACVEKMLGNGMCHILTQDNKKGLLHIRNKFRGRGKRDNTVKMGTFVLAGERHFETVKAGKLVNFDLLEVYSDADSDRLKKNVDDVDWSVFKTITDMANPGSCGVDDDGISFYDNTGEEAVENEILETLKDKNEKPASFIMEGEQVDFDDI